MQRTDRQRYRSIISKDAIIKMCNSCKVNVGCIARRDFINYHCEKLELHPDAKKLELHPENIY